MTADGTPKLLDFGVAKLIEDDSSNPLTRAEDRLLTPEYASPEQFRADAARQFKVAESTKLELRAESFNLPNHPNFNLPENRVDIISGGGITRAKNNRNFQLGARLEF